MGRTASLWLREDIPQKEGVAETGSSLAVISPDGGKAPEDTVLEAWITYNRATGRYGFSFRFEGLPPHYEMASFRSLGDAVAWADPWEERVWEKPSDGDECHVLVSRRFRAKETLRK